MQQVIIASTNPVKIEVARRAFAQVFPDADFEFVEIKSDSGVPDQPMDEEARRGAHNRLNFIRERYPDADFWISQEGGIYRDGEQLASRAWITVMDKENFIGESSTASFILPPGIVSYINEGLELGDATDKFFGDVNSKQGVGAIGHLTDGKLNRTEYYLPAAVIALYQIKHKSWF